MSRWPVESWVCRGRVTTTGWAVHPARATRRTCCCSTHPGCARRVAQDIRLAPRARRVDTGPGLAVNHKRVARLMRQAGLQGLYRRRYRRGPTGPATEDDLVQRHFTVEAPNRLWLTDITEHPTKEGKLYCAAVMDAYARLIIGCSIADHMRTELVVDALGMATLRRRPTSDSTILHSDSEYGRRVPGLPDPHSDGWPSGSRCQVLPGVPDSHFRLTSLSYLGSVGRPGAPGEAPRLAVGVT